MILLVADGMTMTAIAATVGISRRFVSKWVQRFQQERLAGLADKAGRGRGRAQRQLALQEQQGVSA
jgi:transposase